MKIFYIVIAVMSLAAFILYAVDKRRAIRHMWRIKEATLLFFGFFGGSVGALLAMLLFRHKTRHAVFWLVNILGLAAQAAVYFLLLKRA